MVSLNRNARQPGGGMTFFSDSLNSYHDDDPLLDTGMPVLPEEQAVSRWMTAEIKKFRSIGTIKAIVLDMFLYVCLVLSAFILPLYCKGRKCGEEDVTSLVLYVHGGTWFLLLLVHIYLSHEHRSSLLHGYFHFHLHTRTLKRLPLFINSAVNAMLVVVSRILSSVCDKEGRCGVLTKARYIQILISLEVLAALVVLVVYLVKTVRFNKARDTPDFLRTSTHYETPRIQNQIGFRAPFSMQTWAMRQCWGEVYLLRHSCRHLIEEKEKLAQHLHHSSYLNNIAIN